MARNWRTIIRRVALLSLLLTPLLPLYGASDRFYPGYRKTGTIVPQPFAPETFSDTPEPLTFRIINRSRKQVYLQGVHQEEARLQLFFYHRDGKGGWKPFFESLPCDLPTCRNLHAPRKSCSKAVPFVIPLGPAGAPDSVKEFHWAGALYQQSEATQEDRSKRYCYKGWVPKSGKMRVEVEFSESVQNRKEKKGMIGGRDHARIEFSLPAARRSYDLFIGD